MCDNSNDCFTSGSSSKQLIDIEKMPKKASIGNFVSRKFKKLPERKIWTIRWNCAQKIHLKKLFFGTTFWRLEGNNGQGRWSLLEWVQNYSSLLQFNSTFRMPLFRTTITCFILFRGGCEPQNRAKLFFFSSEYF